MTRVLARSALSALALCAAVCVDFAAVSTARADTTLRRQPQYDLFYNYYVGGGINGRGGHPAEMYPSPLPVPDFVGHTYITYQPLMPHEFMYKHKRRYCRYETPLSVLPTNRTKVRWH